MPNITGHIRLIDVVTTNAANTHRTHLAEPYARRWHFHYVEQIQQNIRHAE